MAPIGRLSAGGINGTNTSTSNLKQTTAHCAWYSEAGLSPCWITSLISGYKHLSSNLPAIFSNITNMELVLIRGRGEGEHAVFPSFRQRLEEGGGGMFCHDATSKKKTLFLQRAAAMRVCRQSQWRKLPVRVGIERLNVLLLVAEQFLYNTSKRPIDIDCFLGFFFQGRPKVFS